MKNNDDYNPIQEKIGRKLNSGFADILREIDLLSETLRQLVINRAESLEQYVCEQLMNADKERKVAKNDAKLDFLSQGGENIIDLPFQTNLYDSQYLANLGDFKTGTQNVGQVSSSRPGNFDTGTQMVEKACE